MNPKRPNNLKHSSFTFHHEDHKIRVIFSFWSGHIEVFVDDQSTGILKSFSEHAVLFFKIDQIPHSVTLKTVSILKGPMRCILRKQGEIVQQRERPFNRTTGVIPLLLFTAIATALGRLAVWPLIKLTTLPFGIIYLIQGGLIVAILSVMIFWKKAFLGEEYGTDH